MLHPCSMLGRVVLPIKCMCALLWQEAQHHRMYLPLPSCRVQGSCRPYTLGTQSGLHAAAVLRLLCSGLPKP